jgi:ribonuclease HI
LGLQKLKAMGIRRVVLKSDSQVIIGQVYKNSKARDLKLENILTLSKGWKLPSKDFQLKISQEGIMNKQTC